MAERVKQECNHQPYIEWECYGRYMEPGQLWTARLVVCSEQCDMRFSCHKKKSQGGADASDT